MRPARDPTPAIDDALRQLEQALATLHRLTAQGEHVVTVEGIAHELAGLVSRLQGLRDELAVPGADRER